MLQVLFFSGFDYENRDFDVLILGAAANRDPLFTEELGTNIIEETVDR
ncbi:hypothetical protein ACFYTS_21505 [Nocardia sp. NPDC004151]